MLYELRWRSLFIITQFLGIANNMKVRPEIEWPDNIGYDRDILDEQAKALLLKDAETLVDGEESEALGVVVKYGCHLLAAFLEDAFNDRLSKDLFYAPGEG